MRHARQREKTVCAGEPEKETTVGPHHQDHNDQRVKMVQKGNENEDRMGRILRRVRMMQFNSERIKEQKVTIDTQCS